MTAEMRGNSYSPHLTSLLTRAFIVAVFLLCASPGWPQTAPQLTITPLGTNQFSFTITNGISTGNYELWWTPVLGDTMDYPWMTAAVGVTGQTNFALAMGDFQTGFFQAFQDTNSIPLWEAADPNNQSAGILSVWIDSPTNGATLN